MSLDKKVLFFARDPGGASALISIILSFTCKDVYAKDYAVHTFAQNSITCKAISSIDTIQDELQKYALIVTGTSYLDNSDKELWFQAKEQNIPSVAYFDHWMNFKRFFHTDRNREIFPDYIITIDTLCKEALLQNNPRCTSKVYALGNTYLQKVLQENGALDLGDEFDKNYLYCAEKIKGYEIERKYGVNEFDQFELLVKILDTQNEKIRLYFRPHPKHNIQKIKQYLNSLQTKNAMLVLDESDNKYPLLNAVDAVFGMNSMVLIEALLRNKRVCSLGNGIKKQSNFELLRKNIIFYSKTDEDIRNFIENKIQTTHYNSSNIQDSTDKIITFINDLL